ncbi:MAG: EAL domain-containing protein [Acidimicrobiales bacterium]
MRPTVLFVDDEEEVTTAVRLALRRQPWDVATANSASAGLDILRTTPVDVVVSDEQMPRVSGSAFLAAVREEFPNVERIILTGQASVEATIAAINDARIFRFLTKPCPTGDLVSCISDALESRRSRLALSEPAGEVDEGLAAAFSEALSLAYMVYQPIFSVRDSRIHAYEALVRVDHPSISSPAQLIEAARSLDRGLDLDRRVRELVAADIPSAPGDAALFVNLLPESLDDPELLHGAGGLGEHAARVVLEITERAPLDTIDGVESKFDRLRCRGYRLALNDLGAGYAGLTSFATMQPDVVKFDMDLIRNIHRSPTRGKLISSMVALCRDLDTLTVAEGVETEDELDHLVALGCDLFQGYVISKPGRPFVALT